MIVNPSVKVIDQAHGKNWSAYNGDSCQVVQGIPDNSIHFQVMSCPFASLFVYSGFSEDLGNCRNDQEFFQHYEFLCHEQLRITMPGRLCAVHVMNLPTTKGVHGHIGLRDFRGDVIRLYERSGWIWHSEVCIWKCPVVAVTRTKALGLLHKQIKKDSAMCRQGIPDYLLVFRKPGDNPERVTHTNETFPVPVWQRYASPVWATMKPDPDEEGMAIFEEPNQSNPDQGGINPTDTLQVKSARDHKDERHLCPLALPIIRRAIRLWTNPNDIVFTPFMGIGSEPYVALQEGRRGLGIELKPSYFRQAVANLRNAEAYAQSDLFASLEA